MPRFLLAQLHADSLAKKQSRRDIRVALQNLPNELKGTYDEVMCRINNQDIEDAGLAKRVLSWLSCALIPLRVVELQHALAITENDLSIDEEAFIDEELLVSVCCGMVIVDPGSDIIQLVHTTAQEYLDLTRQEHIPDAHTIIARSCLLYLSSDTIIDQVPENYEEQELRLQTFPFINYSSRCWGIHLQISSDQECEELAFNMLKDDVKLLPAGHFLYTWHQGKAGNYQAHFNGLHLAANYGLTSLAKLLVTRTAVDVNLPDSNEKTPLYIALSYSYDLLAEYLISLPGLDINAGRKTLLGQFFMQQPVLAMSELQRYS